jgi:hypothetical protein
LAAFPKLHFFVLAATTTTTTTTTHAKSVREDKGEQV